MQGKPIIQKVGKISSLDHGNSGSLANGFASLQDGYLGRLGVVTGLLLRSEVTVDESTAAADLPWENLLSLISSMTIQTPRGNWCAALAGRSLFNYLTKSGIMDGLEAGDQNLVDLMHMTDISSSASAQTIDQTYFVPFAPYAFGQQNFSGEDVMTGAIPIASLKQIGDISVTACTAADLGGNWRFDSGTDTMDVTVYAYCVYPRNPITYVHSWLHSITSSEDRVEIPIGEQYGALDFLAVLDDAFSSFTDPNEPRLIIDDKTQQQLVEGVVLTKSVAPYRRMKVEACSDDGCLILTPEQFFDASGFLRGTSFKVAKAGSEHSGSELYLAHGFGSPTEESVATQLQQAKIHPDMIRKVRDDFRMMEPRRGSRVQRRGLPVGVDQEEQFRTVRERAGRTFTLVLNRS